MPLQHDVLALEWSVVKLSNELGGKLECHTHMFKFKLYTHVVQRRSLQHDALALERIAVKLSNELGGKLKCEGGTGVGSVWWAPVGALAMWPVALWLKKRVYKPKLEKLY